MVDLSATSAAELLQQLRALDIAVPMRSEGRKTLHCERWSICRFLATYAETGLLQYPLRLEKRERPDFLLQLPRANIGIEVTEAVPPDWARAGARREKLDCENFVFLQRFRPGEPRRSKDEIHSIARGAGAGDGWAGDAPEREWAEAMAYFASRKAEKLQSPGYKRFSVDWLLIYDNWPLPAVDYQKAAAHFVQRLHALEQPLPFERLFIECKQFIWDFHLLSENGGSPQRICDVWADE